MALLDLLARTLERRMGDRRLLDRRQSARDIDFPERRMGDRRTRSERRTDRD